MSAEPTLSPGLLVAGRFRCTGLIARGGMGAVYEALDERLGRQVALKVLRSELAQDQTLLARFEREALAAARLAHPGIAQVLDFGTTEAGLAYLVMERIQGETFGALLAREGRLSARRAADLVEQALGSLASAHAAGIVHRDLKPGNLMVVPTGASREAVKVLDFGIAQIAAGEAYTRLTRTGVVLGTPAFMAPEQATGGVIDGRTDVYAMGVLLWCLLTGRKPFAGKDMAAVIEDVLSTVPPRADAIAPDVPAELASIAAMAMQKDPSQRFQDATAMASALVAFRAHEGRAPSVLPAAPRISAPSPEPARASLPQLAPAPVLASPSAVVDLAAPAASSSRWQQVRAALFTRRTILGSVAVGGLAASCLLGAVLAILPTYFLASGWTLAWPTVPAASPSTAPPSTAPPVTAPRTQTPVAWQPPPFSPASASECAHMADCCDSYVQQFAIAGAGCSSYRTHPDIFGAAFCVETRRQYAGALSGVGHDPSACRDR